MQMKKSLVFLAVLISFFLISSVSAVDLTVKKTDKGSVVIAELKNPAIYDFEVDNNEGRDIVEIYSLIGISMTPKGMFELLPGINKFEVQMYPSADIRRMRGLYTFEYQIKGDAMGIFKDSATIEIVELKDAISIEPQNIEFLSDGATIMVNNLENTNLNNLKLRFKSIFFDSTKEISLKPYEKKTIGLEITNPKMAEVVAGKYVVTTEIELEGVQTKSDSVVSYLEKSGTSVSSETSGLLIRTTEITKKNEGNTKVTDRIEVKKNILTRLFTSFSATPLSTERNGLIVNYVWERDLKPAESWTVRYTTNYTFPVLFVLLIAFAAFMVYIYSRTTVVLQKRVTFVKTKGGEFAVKVKLHIKARKPVESIEISDRIPGATKLYEKDENKGYRIEQATRRIIWDIDRLNAGEERVFSYIIYSTISIVGKFELPSAVARFTKDGKTQHVYSNRTFFVSDIYPR